MVAASDRRYPQPGLRGPPGVTRAVVGPPLHCSPKVTVVLSVLFFAPRTVEDNTNMTRRNDGRCPWEMRRHFISSTLPIAVRYPIQSHGARGSQRLPRARRSWPHLPRSETSACPRPRDLPASGGDQFILNFHNRLDLVLATIEDPVEVGVHHPIPAVVGHVSDGRHGRHAFFARCEPETVREDMRRSMTGERSSSQALRP